MKKLLIGLVMAATAAPTLVAPAGMKTETGTAASLLSLLDTGTVTPPAGAPEVVEMVLLKEKEIKDGLFRVNVNDAEPKSTM